MKEILCGSSCVKYILDNYKIDTKKINISMQWTTELAICLKENNISNIKIYCFNSNLYEDYKDINKRDLSYDGFKHINRCHDLGIEILEKKLTKKELLKEIEDNDFIILCVQSSKFNDENLSGGHFIILNGYENGMIKIINPTKDKYKNKLEKIEDIINYCKDYGSWRILIRA